MVIQHVTQAIRDAVNEGYETIVGNDTQRAHYTKYIAIGLATFVALGSSWGMYQWYVSYKERTAQRVFMQYLDEYQKAYQSNVGWSSVEDLFALGSQQHSSSNLYPYFLLFKSDALVKQGKYQEAIQSLDQVRDSMHAKDPLQYLVGVKSARLQLDMPDESFQKAGSEQLHRLAELEQPFQDMAQYYLGLHYWHSRDTEQAQKVWSMLLEQHGDNMMSPSIWAEQAGQMLDQIA